MRGEVVGAGGVGRRRRGVHGRGRSRRGRRGVRGGRGRRVVRALPVRGRGGGRDHPQGTVEALKCVSGRDFYLPCLFLSFITCVRVARPEVWALGPGLLVHGPVVVAVAQHGLVGLEVVEGGRVAVAVEGEPVLLVLQVDPLLPDGRELPALGKEHYQEGGGAAGKKAKAWKLTVLR